MSHTIEDLNQAIEEALSKSTSNARAHIQAATMAQEDHDKHTDALAHHAGAIEYYRNKPEVKNFIDHLQKNVIPLKEYVNKKIKLDGSKAPTVSAEDLNMEHPMLKGRSDEDKQSIANSVNDYLKDAHNKIHSNPDIKALNEHGDRFLSHLSAMLEWHNLQKKGEGAHHQFVGKVEGPELQGNFEDSKYRGHSTPSATDRNKFRTQAITKQGGANWHPGMPELTALNESVGHPSSGKPKELYPFREIKVNGEALVPHTFSDETPPPPIHPQDYATNLTKDHAVVTPDGQSAKAIGAYQGTKTADKNIKGMEDVGMFKKSMSTGICDYFPHVSIARFILAKNIITSMNPFDGVDDEMFADLTLNGMSVNNESTQAIIMAEAASRLEKAKREDYKRPAPSAVDRRKAIEDVLSGKVSPLPHSEAGERTKKEGEKRSELEDLGYEPGARKRSPYAVPKDVFTDDTYTKVDPEKYKEYVNGDMTDQDLRNEQATYSNVVKYNPEAQKRHKAYIDMERETSKEKLGAAPKDEEGGETVNPEMAHKSNLKQLSLDLQAGKISPQEFAQKSKESATSRASQVTHKAGGAELTPEEQRVKEADPTYQPSRPGAGAKADAKTEKDLTSIARGKVPSHLMGDKANLSGEEDEFSAARAKEMTHQKGEDGASTISGSVTQEKTPMQLIQEHPGFANYLKFKEHMLSHYKDPAVKKYMEDKINQHENNPDMDPAKLAGIYHILHRAKFAAEQAGSKPDVRSMMSPEENARFNEVKGGQPASEPTKMPEMPSIANAPEPVSDKAPVQTATAEGGEAPKPKIVIRRPAK